MGDTSEPHTCRGCGTADTDVTWRGDPFGTLCSACWASTEAGVDHEQAEAEGADAPAPPAPPICRACGREQDRFPTGYGHWILLEPEVRPAARDIPEGHRWVVCEDGAAVNWAGGQPPPYCRIAHRPVCSKSLRPEKLPRVFLAAWELNVSYERRIYEQGTLPFTDEAE